MKKNVSNVKEVKKEVKKRGPYNKTSLPDLISKTNTVKPKTIVNKPVEKLALVLRYVQKNDDYESATQAILRTFTSEFIVHSGELKCLLYTNVALLNYIKNALTNGAWSYLLHDVVSYELSVEPILVTSTKKGREYFDHESDDYIDDRNGRKFAIQYVNGTIDLCYGNITQEGFEEISSMDNGNNKYDFNYNVNYTYSKHKIEEVAKVLLDKELKVRRIDDGCGNWSDAYGGDVIIKPWVSDKNYKGFRDASRRFFELYYEELDKVLLNKSK